MRKKRSIETDKIIRLLCQAGLVSEIEADTFKLDGEILPLNSDGSSRRFFRIRNRGRNICLAVAPEGARGYDLAEARSAWHIGSHLRQGGNPVPEIYGWDEDNGLILFEDLGDMRLHDLLKTQGTKERRPWYRKIIDRLIFMQVEGINGFDTAWCYDTPRYDRDLMIARESRYFLNAYWHDMLEKEIPDGIEDEFAVLAMLADADIPDVFLHRDFQSRNIMIKDEEVRFIDFQAGRLGPPGYDLASLLIDPYMALDPEFQEELIEYYLASPVVGRMVSRIDFRRQYPFLALQRNLQIIGAFSFLYRVRKKVFFQAHIIPALTMLHRRLQAPVFADFKVLREMVESAVVH